MHSHCFGTRTLQSDDGHSLCCQKDSGYIGCTAKIFPYNGVAGRDWGDLGLVDLLSSGIRNITPVPNYLLCDEGMAKLYILSNYTLGGGLFVYESRKCATYHTW